MCPFWNGAVAMPLQGWRVEKVTVAQEHVSLGSGTRRQSQVMALTSEEWAGRLGVANVIREFAAICYIPRPR